MGTNVDLLRHLALLAQAAATSRCATTRRSDDATMNDSSPMLSCRGLWKTPAVRRAARRVRRRSLAAPLERREPLLRGRLARVAVGQPLDGALIPGDAPRPAGCARRTAAPCDRRRHRPRSSSCEHRQPDHRRRLARTPRWPATSRRWPRVRLASASSLRPRRDLAFTRLREQGRCVAEAGLLRSTAWNARSASAKRPADSARRPSS